MALLNVTSAVSRLFLASAAPSRTSFVALATARPFSCLVRSAQSPTQPPPQSSSVTLPSAVAAWQPCRSLHHKGKPGRRCGSCWIEIIDEKMHVFCNKHPRHRQVQKTDGPGAKGQWIMTHATQGSKGFRGNGTGHSRMKTQSGFRMDF